MKLDEVKTKDQLIDYVLELYETAEENLIEEFCTMNQGKEAKEELQKEIIEIKQKAKELT